MLSVGCEAALTVPALMVREMVAEAVAKRFLTSKPTRNVPI
jgi:hypothetical protein